MLNAPGVRREFINAARRARIDVAEQIFGDGADVVAGESVIASAVIDKTRMLAGRVINAAQSVVGRPHPQSALLV